MNKIIAIFMCAFATVNVNAENKTKIEKIDKSNMVVKTLNEKKKTYTLDLFRINSTQYLVRNKVHNFNNDTIVIFDTKGCTLPNGRYKVDILSSEKEGVILRKDRDCKINKVSYWKQIEL